MNVYIREVCRALSERGVATDVFTVSGDGASPTQLAPLSLVIPVNAPTDRTDKYSLLDVAPLFADRIAAAATLRPYDAIYSHYWLSGAVAALLQPRLGIPWLHTAHTLALVKNRTLPVGARPEPAIRAQVEQQIARSADLLIASTETERSDLVTLYGADPALVAVVPPGVNLDRFSPQPAGRKPDRVLFVGRLERLKGVDLALRAVAQLATNHPDLELVVAGDDSSADDGGEKDRLRLVADVLGIADRVKFIGPVSQDELPGLYSGAAVCVVPSYSESFGLVALEAQASGCPVVAARLPGLRSIVREGVTGLLVERQEPGAYAAALDVLLSDPELAALMGRRGTLLAQRFTWSRTADLVLGRLRRLVASPHVGVQLSATHE
jgi:D-inositol-3-phosphate glycosyltransferase